MSEASSKSAPKRAEELDALDAILPFDRCGQLATLLNNDDVATLKHLASEGEVISFRALLLALLESGNGSASHRAPEICEALRRPSSLINSSAALGSNLAGPVARWLEPAQWVAS